MKCIPLSRGKVSIVDDDDFDKLSVFSWHCTLNGRAARIHRNAGSRKPITVFMHRDIIGNVPIGMEVDHINCDPLDNRKSNLRLATVNQNQWNRKNYKSNRTGFKGVGFHKASNRFRARIQKYGKQVLLGWFETPEQAAVAYAVAAAQLHGDFARIA